MKNAPQIEEQLGNVVRAVRIERCLSQEQLSFESGLHRTYIGAVERGEKNLTVKNLVRIARALGTTAAELLSHAEL